MIYKLIFISLLTLDTLFPIHTIYVSGPPTYKNRRWHKQSKVLYNALRSEVHRQSNEIELFPKRIYRANIKRVESRSAEDSIDLVDNTSANKYLSKKEMVRLYENLDRLLDDLTMLILKRSNECEDKIHLIGHGRGGELLLLLKEGKYKNIIGSCVVFDGDESLYENTSEDTEGQLDIYDGDVIDIALKSNGNLVLNFDLPKAFGIKNSNKGEIVALATGIVGVIAAILALL